MWKAELDKTVERRAAAHASKTAEMADEVAARQEESNRRFGALKNDSDTGFPRESR